MADAQILACVQVVMVNSSWTRKHVRQLWWKLEDPKRVYPPCNTKALQVVHLCSSLGVHTIKKILQVV